MGTFSERLVAQDQGTEGRTVNEWHKSSYSATDVRCVEVKEMSDSVLMRDTQNRELGHLSFTLPEWGSFLGDLKADSVG
ncbi:DUF397 domain-containing protein [Nocardiopsis sp. FIRDI 009]|uniref:DUF397 domain-containing protein n=1 Tax=Nocardiopsis sp. FIRDI 009 TaxID=714197 RepID=UPI000E220A01